MVDGFLFFDKLRKRCGVMRTLNALVILRMNTHMNNYFSFAYLFSFNFTGLAGRGNL